MRRRWNEKMAMYVAQVEANEQKNKSAEKTGKNKENVQKKPSKKESKKDSKKGSKKGKKKQEGSGIDRVGRLKSNDCSLWFLFRFNCFLCGSLKKFWVIWTRKRLKLVKK